jgi:Flp pilus assembly pilin Flp
MEVRLANKKTHNYHALAAPDQFGAPTDGRGIKTDWHKGTYPEYIQIVRSTSFTGRMSQAQEEKEEEMELVKRILKALRPENGQTLVEYALIIALVSIILVVALQLLAGGIDDVFQDIVAAF